MPAYVIYQAEISDEGRYGAYRELAGPAVAAAGGRYLVRGGESVSLEGETPPQRTIVIEFPDRAAAQAWYESDAYRAAREVRAGAATARAYVVEGAL